MDSSVIDVGVPRKNREGYADPTMYQALKQVQRAEYGYRPLVYICSPYAGDTETNIEIAREFCAVAVKQRVIPLAPHLLFPQFMNDQDPDARELAMFLTGFCYPNANKSGSTAPRSVPACESRSHGRSIWRFRSGSSMKDLRRLWRETNDHVHRGRCRPANQRLLPTPAHRHHGC